MELKKFEAPTLAEALQVIKREMGPEAVILSTKNKKSAWGLMNRSSVEVTAAVSPDALGRKRQAETRLNEDQREAMFRKPAQKVAAAYEVLSGERIAAELEKTPATRVTTRAEAAMAVFQKRPASTIQQSTPSSQRSQSSGGSTVKSTSVKAAAPTTQRRYIDIRDDDAPAEAAMSYASDRTQFQSAPSLVERATTIAQAQAQAQAQNHFQGHGQTQFAQPQPLSNPGQGLVRPRGPASPALPVSGKAILPRLLARLIEAGVEDELVKDIGDEMKAIMVREQLTQEDLLQMQLARIVMSRVRVARPLGDRLRVPTNPRVIVFVGPTGVGKTTTIAKIAAELVIHQKRSVTLATTDTYKIAAVEQLQTYANILKMPLEVCPTAEALSDLSARLGSEDVVLIDTAGFGPRDEKKVQELSEILSAIRMETHLCVSATTRDRDLRDMVKRFGVFHPDYLVVTKTDETSIYGNVFNIAVRSHHPLSYFTMGQRVPEDIEVATKERLADLILNITGEV